MHIYAHILIIKQIPIAVVERHINSTLQAENIVIRKFRVVPAAY